MKFGTSIMNLLNFVLTLGTPIERVTSGVPVIDTNHAQIHEKNAYSFYHRAALAGGGVLNITIQVPTDTYVHFQAAEFTTDGGNDVELAIFEGTTLNAVPGGTAIVPTNRHRIDPPASILTVKHGASITSDGTQIGGNILYKSGTPASRSVGQKQDGVEWVLKPNTTYLFRFTNGATTASNMVFRPFWYEEGGA